MVEVSSYVVDVLLDDRPAASDAEETTFVVELSAKRRYILQQLRGNKLPVIFFTHAYIFFDFAPFDTLNACIRAALLPFCDVELKLYCPVVMCVTSLKHA